MTPVSARPVPECSCGHSHAEHTWDEVRARIGYDFWCARCECRRYMMPLTPANYSDLEWVAWVHGGCL